jgi:sRNA-binding protein
MRNKEKQEFWKSVNELLPLLCERYPKTFFPKGSMKTLPLKIGIAQDLMEQNIDIKAQAIAMFIKQYTAKGRYLRAIATRPWRIDLKGNPCGEVSEKHRNHALKKLAARQTRKEAA